VLHYKGDVLHCRGIVAVLERWAALGEGSALERGLRGSAGSVAWRGEGIRWSGGLGEEENFFVFGWG